jgi:hypothetical protein
MRVEGLDMSYSLPTCYFSSSLAYLVPKLGLGTSYGANTAE